MKGGLILALESSTSTGSAAIGNEEGVIAEMVVDVMAGHSSALLPAADRVLAVAGVRPADLAAVVVGGGPGSFTGLRIAAATARGIWTAVRMPFLAYSGLLATAAAAWGSEAPVCALFDARRRDVFAACYAFRSDGIEELMAPEAVAVDALVERFRGSPPPLFAGEGAQAYREELEAELGARVVPAHLGHPRASALIWLAVSVPDRGLVADPAAWEPDYLRASGAERIAARARRDEGP